MNRIQASAAVCLIICGVEVPSYIPANGARFRKPTGLLTAITVGLQKVSWSSNMFSNRPVRFALAITRDRIARYELKSRNELESAVEFHLAAIRNRRDARAEAKACITFAPARGAPGPQTRVV